MKRTDPLRYVHLQTEFTGNLTTMCNHIHQMGMGHFEIYECHCIEHGIPINEHAIPEREKQQRDGINTV